MADAATCRACGSPCDSGAALCHQCSPAAARDQDFSPTEILCREEIETLASETIAGRYRVVGELGRGGFGVVVRAEDRRLGRQVAIKRLDRRFAAASAERSRFEREARILASLDHPNIVPIFDAGLDNDRPFIAMKLVQGCSLRQRLRSGPLDLLCALQVLHQVTAGLAHAHSRQVIHRDIKPSNILQDREGKTYFLADFGLAATAYDPHLTQQGAIVGTIHYLAPEAIAGQASPSSDLYSLGAVLYETVFGATCFAADDARQLLWKIANRAPPLLAQPPAGTSSGLVTLLRRLLAKEPTLRPASAAAVADEIDRLLAQATVSDGPVPTSREQTPSPAPEQESMESLVLSDSIEKLEGFVEQLVRIAEEGSSPVDHDRVLELLSSFISGTSVVVDKLSGAVTATAHDSRYHTLVLSLHHLSREVERRLESLQPKTCAEYPLQGTIMHLQVRLIAPLGRLLQQLEERSRQQAGAETDFFAFDDEGTRTTAVTGSEYDDTEWLDGLLSDNELRRHEAVLTIAGGGLQQCLDELRRRPAEERERLLDGLWYKADVLLLEGRGRSRPVFELAQTLASTPAVRERWLHLYMIFQKVSGAYWDPQLVQELLSSHEAGDRRVLGRALLFHPWQVYRSLALAVLEPADFWDLIAHEKVPLPWLLEIWRHLRPLVDTNYLKVFLVCARDRMKQTAGPRDTITVVELLKELFEVDCFHERFFFTILEELNDWLRAEAARHHLLVDFDAEYVQRMREFLAKPKQDDQPIESWQGVPLPIQRLLARRGHFLKHFSCHPVDLIALECLDHLTCREEVSDFVELFAINSKLLTELARHNHLFRSDRARFALVANPKTPAFLVLRYIGYLRADSLAKLSKSREHNQFARVYAEKTLKKRSAGG